jgi:regulator of extracellular matrix RemA (YlzA/DUF370 family)
MEEKIKSVITGIFTIIAIIVLIVWLIPEKEPLKPILSNAQERQLNIDKQFSEWDGSHIELTKIIKSAMNDPNSFEQGELVYYDKDSFLIIVSSFYGKNAFGGVVKSTVKAKVEVNTGYVIEIFE